MGECRPKKLKYFTHIHQWGRGFELVECEVHGDSEFSSPDLMNTNTFHFVPKDNDTDDFSDVASFIQKIIIRGPPLSLATKKDGRTSLIVQWLRLHTLNAGGQGLIPGWGIRFHVPQVKSWHASTKDPACCN